MGASRDKEPALQWIRPPVQGRSERTLARILDATEALLLERTFEQLTVQDIVARADASVGSFYARFKSKDDLLSALHERYVRESHPTTERALDPALWNGVPLATLVEQIVAFLVEQTWANRGLKRALVIAVAKGEPGFRERSSTLAAFVVDTLAALLAARGDTLGGKDPRTAADFVHRLVFSFLDQVVSFAPDDPIARPRSRAELARELVTATLAYLLASSLTATSDAPSDDGRAPSSRSSAPSTTSSARKSATKKPAMKKPTTTMPSTRKASVKKATAKKASTAHARARTESSGRRRT